MTKFVALSIRKKCVVKKTPNFVNYKQCLFAGESAFRKQQLFQNKLQELQMNKLELSSDDHKRVIQSDGVSTLAHGHCHRHKNAPKNLVSDILQWSGFGEMNVTMRKVDVEKDLEYS